MDTDPNRKVVIPRSIKLFTTARGYIHYLVLDSSSTNLRRALCYSS